MRLLFAVKALSTMGGGAERVFVDVANGLRARGHDLAVLTFEPADSTSFYTLSDDIARIDIGRSGSSRAELLFSLPRLRRRVQRFEPDAVLAFMPSCYVPLSAALACSGIPVIASEHNVPARYTGKPLLWASMLAVTPLVQRFTAVSTQMREEYPTVIGRKMDVLPNPVSVSKGAEANVLDGNGGRKRLIAVGRLHEQKDHLTLIRAFSRLAPDFPDWTLRILGDGRERKVLEAEIDTLGLAGCVELAGTVRDIDSEYRQAQLYAISSRYESFGLATVEALAHGLPAVGFADCPGTNQLIIDGHNGLLVDPGTDRIAALVAALRVLMQDPHLRKTLASGAWASSADHALPSVLDAWEKLARSVAPSRA